MNIYLAGRIEGLTLYKATHWRKKASTWLGRHKVFNPVPLVLIEKMHEEEAISFNLVKVKRELAVRDLFNLTRSDVVLVKLDDMASEGTFIELGVAHALQIPIVGWGLGKVRNHPYTEVVLNLCYDSLEDAVNFINSLEGE